MMVVSSWQTNVKQQNVWQSAKGGSMTSIKLTEERIKELCGLGSKELLKRHGITLPKEVGQDLYSFINYVATVKYAEGYADRG